VTPVDELRQAAPATAIYTNLDEGTLAELIVRQGSWLVGPYLDEAGQRLSAIRTYVVRAGGQTILVDTCVGNHKARAGTGFDRWHMLETPFLEDLAAAGVRPEDVDVVVCTHLHIDHVGWNTRWDGARWVPTFPNARYLWVDEEWWYWRKLATDTADSLLVDDSMQPVVDAGLVDLVDVDAELAPGVSFFSTPGHTPGHCSVLLESDGSRALITGDFMHHAVQVAAPEWCSHFDSDAAAAERTRREFIEASADTDLLVIGTHFGGPGAGRIVSTDGGHVFAAAD
jgi:glyoxylase-like metal-dependent hydrolase (beta-lactamase superfamily II)